MKRALSFLWRHPLIWLVPLLVYGLLAGYLLSKTAESPQDAFIYKL
jgi:hypothetical protein